MGTGTFLPQILKPLPAASKAFGMYMDTLPDFRLLYSKWNAISRIDVIDSSRCMLPWFPEDESYAPHMAITIDGDATTWMWNFNAPSTEICGIRDNLYASAYHAKDRPEVLIIGLGGGNDLRTAVHYRADRVVGVELNPLIVELLTEKYTDFVDNVAYAPNVEIHVGEGRSFVRRSGDKFDIIQMSGVDTWSGLSSGAYVLSENYLYTVEAFNDYMDHLKDDGVLAVVRWYFKPPREMMRMLSVGSKVLSDRGNPEPWKHIIVMVSGDFCATLFKKTPWTQQELARYTWYARNQENIEITYSPGCNLTNPFADYMTALETGTADRFRKNYIYNLTPVYDDNPFFFDYYKWSNLPDQIFSSGTGGQIGANWPIAMAILSAMLVQAFLLTLVFIFYPLTRFEQSGLDVPHAARIMIYFLCLGIGFIFIEIVLMQKLVLYLGHPVYSISVVLTSLLFFSGLGSLAASKFPWKKPHFLTVMLGIVALSVLVLRGILPIIVDATLQETLAVRIACTLALLAVPGFLMGIPFPTGLAIVGRRAKPFIPWAWGTNGGATVLGSIMAIIVAMTFNFTVVILTGAAVYVCAAVAFLPFSKKPY